MLLNGWKLAQACRCQILIGSFEGSNLSCSCESPNNCPLFQSEREELVSHPKVLEAKAKNKADYDAQNTAVR